MNAGVIISAVLATFVVISCTIPYVDDMTIDYNQYVDDGWYYDDYKAVDDVSAVDGVFELVTVSDVQYVHATDVGSGTITYSDSTTETVDVEKANLDVVVALGQSNNAYYSANKWQATAPQIGTSYYYGDTVNDNEVLYTGNYYESQGQMMPMVGTYGAAMIGDKAPPFCAAYYGHSYHKVYYICGAWGGTSITTWQPDTQHYEAAKTNITNAMSVIDTDKFNVTTRCYTWIQGEADEDMSKSDYYDYFVTMHEAIMDGGMGIDLDHCFISKVKSIYAGPAEAQIQAANNLTTVTLATEIADTFTVDNGLLSDDDLHYSQAGDNLIGKALGDSATYFYYPWVREDTPLSNLTAAVPFLCIALILCALAAAIISKRDY